ncbi:MAG: hypothetical protein L0Z70_13075 [Chloroflexi bacterium]|nr:hypothetical protein [Chloroflexota bacterium]
MDENIPPRENLGEEFAALGQNLVKALRSAWDSPERKTLQEEIEKGLGELGQTLKSETDRFAQSPSGQRMKEEVEDFHQRVRSGEAEEKARQELLNALRLINSELEKVATRWGGGNADR